MIGAQIIEQFTCKGRRCVILQMNALRVAGMNQYHNGYVQVFPEEILKDYFDYHFHTEEITFQGKIKLKGVNANTTWIGFDTVHAHNMKNPSSQTAEAVKLSILNLVKELENKK